MVLNEIAYFQIFGKPLIMYLGITTLLLFLLTAVIGVLILRGKTRIPFKWHKRLAIIAIIFALIHGSLGILAYF